MPSLTMNEVVRMQLNSPDFADWCVTNVSDPAYDYLFSKGAARRAEFEQTLQAARASLASGASVVGAPLRAGNPTTNGNGLSSQTASPPASANPSHCAIALPTATIFAGPHQPYQLQGADKQLFENLIAKLTSANAATTGPHAPSMTDLSKELVEFMKVRKTKTESMVHRLVAGMGGVALEKRVLIFFTLSTLFYEHRVNAEPGYDAAYMAVFATYLPEALRLTLLQCKMNDKDVGYLSSIVKDWEDAEAFNRSTLARMRTILATKSGTPV